MLAKVKTEFLSLNGKKILLYYILFSFIFTLVNLLSLSVFVFFHFLLEHDMSTIENWLNRNTWEILILSKLVALFLSTKITKLNLVDDIKYRDVLKRSFRIPSIRVGGLVFFILTIFYAFITQFGGGVNVGQFKEELFYSSFIGSFFFYSCDFVFMYILFKIYSPEKRDLSKVMYLTLLIFIGSSKLALPYLSKYYIFLMVHFLSLYIFLLKDQLSDSFIYALFVIAPLSSIYGLDIVWDNSYSLFSYQKPLPVLGIIGIWLLGLGYYHTSRVD